MARAMAMLPHMSYKVGDTTTECCKTAHAKAEASNEPIVYLVGDKSFHCKDSAMKALAAEIESHYASLAKVSPVVDGEMMHCSKMAAQAAAAKNTKVKYCVAGVNFDCPKEAEAVAAKLASKMNEFRGSCAKTCDKAKTASAEGGCAKTCDKAKAASAKADCSKSCDKAETASAKADCAKTCDKAKTALDDAKAGCAKTCDKAETASSKAGCPKSCTKSADEAQTASADEVDADSPELAQAKAVVRQMVEFVSSQRTS